MGSHCGTAQAASIAVQSVPAGPDQALRQLLPMLELATHLQHAAEGLVTLVTELLAQHPVPGAQLLEQQGCR